MFDSHIHTKYSDDSEALIDDYCKIAVKKGINGITFTDHVVIYKYKDYDTYNNLLKCKSEALLKRKEYEGKLEILFGLEISEAFSNPKFEEEILTIKDLDVVLCSLHDNMPIESLGFNSYIRKNDFTKISNDKIKQILLIYYGILKETAKKSDYDVLSHITYPFRYINCRDKVGFNVFEIKNDIEEILSTVIKRDKALELNTSMSDDDFFMPSEEILTLYKKLGGEKVTLGSDAHTAMNVGKGFEKGKELLKKCGFSKYYYYKNRKPIPVKI